MYSILARGTCVAISILLSLRKLYFSSLIEQKPAVARLFKYLPDCVGLAVVT